MIDLHMHTTHSDGTDNIKELLKNANKANLELISITDHNTCKSYYDMQDYNIRKLFNGDIIVGCEFTTSYNGHLIEILGYGFDYKEVENYLSNYYNKEYINNYVTIIHNKIVNKMNELGFTFNIPLIDRMESETEFIEFDLYMEMFKHKENKNILNEDIYDSFSKFFRNGLTNPKSKLYIDHASLKPSLKEIIDLIHKNNGLAFLAHPYQYGIKEFDEFLEVLTKEYDLDGLECYYTTFSDDQINYLLYYAKKNNLLVSGGSDYHGKNKTNHNLGIGKGNLNINKNILDDWNIKKPNF